MLKKIAFFAFVSVVFFSTIEAQDTATVAGKIEQKIAALQVKKFVIKNDFSKMISKLYTFNENGLVGGVAIGTMDEYKVDFFVIVLKNKDFSVIKLVDVMDENALTDKQRMKELREGLAKLNEMKVENVSDAITGATQYSKKVFLKIKLMAAQVIKELGAVS